jgi:PilZ domain
MLKKFATDITRGLRSMVRGVDADWDFTERRRTIRFNCRHKVDLLKGDVKTIAYVMDYSMGGVRLAYPGTIKVGEIIKLRFPHPLPGTTVRSLECEIVWRRKNPKTLEMLAGAKFQETKDRMSKSWIAYFFRERNATSRDLVEDRKYIRADCDLEIVARNDDDRAVGQAIDIGLDGANLRLNRPAEPGDKWTLDISGLSTFPGIYLTCEVLSCEPGEAGLFEQRVNFGKIDDDNLKLLRKYLLALCRDFWTAK